MLSPKHSNLVDDVVPIARRLEFLRQNLVKLIPHIDNTVGHRLDIPLPLSEQFRVVENLRDLFHQSLMISSTPLKMDLQSLRRTWEGC